MSTIVFISTFDPINNRFINAFKKFNKSDVSFIFYMLKSDNCSLENRTKLVNLALKNSGINYSFRYDFANNDLKPIDLNKLFIELNNEGLKDLSLLIVDDKDYLMSFDKIMKIKAKYNYNPLIEDAQKDIRDLVNLDMPKELINYIVDNHLYFMEKIEANVSGKRLSHSISVANLAYDVALSNKLVAPDLYFVAGLLHDIGKQLNKEDSVDIMEKYYRSYANYPSWSYHQFTGAYLAKKLFPLVNNECIKAISRHCTGDSNMSKMQKIIYSSDKIEPTRGYDSGDMIEACKKDYNSGFTIVLAKNMEFIGENMSSPSTNFLTNECLEEYLK